MLLKIQLENVKLFACWRVGCPKKFCNPRYLLVLPTKEDEERLQTTHRIFFFFLVVSSNCYAVGSCVLFFNSASSFKNLIPNGCGMKLLNFYS